MRNTTEKFRSSVDKNWSTLVEMLRRKDAQQCSFK